VEVEAAYRECRDKLEKARKEAQHWRDNHKTLRSEVERLRSQGLRTKDAYVAMCYFVKAYWERGGRRDGSITLLLNAIGPSAAAEDSELLLTNDPACWSDWLEAIEQAKRESVPKKL
jgi:hypothetical protein